MPAAVCDGFNQGGAGAEELAHVVMKIAGDGSSDYQPLYPLDLSIREKMETIATKMYGAAGVEYDRKALQSINRIEKLGLEQPPDLRRQDPGLPLRRAGAARRPQGLHHHRQRGEALRRRRSHRHALW